MRRHYWQLACAAFLGGLLLAPLPATPTVTTAGKNAAIQRLIDNAAGVAIWNYVDIGTGTGGGGTCVGDAAGDTTLQTPVGSPRQQDTDATPDPPSPTGAQSLQVTFAAGNGTGTICEVGTFNNVTGGTLLQRKTFTGVSKGASDALQVTITLTVS